MTKSTQVVDPQPVEKEPVEEILHKNIERLKHAFRDWSRASAAYNALAGMQDGTQPSPVLEFTTSQDNTPVKVAIDLGQIPEPERRQVADALLGPVINQYESSLHKIYVASKAAYTALQKQKDAS